MSSFHGKIWSWYKLTLKIQYNWVHCILSLVPASELNKCTNTSQIGFWGQLQLMDWIEAKSFVIVAWWVASCNEKLFAQWVVSRVHNFINFFWHCTVTIVEMWGLGWMNSCHSNHKSWSQRRRVVFSAMYPGNLIVQMSGDQASPVSMRCQSRWSLTCSNHSNKQQWTTPTSEYWTLNNNNR